MVGETYVQLGPWFESGLELTGVHEIYGTLICFEVLRLVHFQQERIAFQVGEILKNSLRNQNLIVLRFA